MPFEGFIHPALAAGTLLAAVPLLIHLLNRQRHRPLQWAAMRFVEAAYRRTRRRARLENLLLLLLRMAAVALLALAIARPFTGSDSPLAPLTENRRDLVLILDGSASTGYRDGVESVHEEILGRAREILASLDSTRGDRVRLFHAAALPRLLAGRSPEDALAALATLSAPTDERLDLTAALNEVVELVEDEAQGAALGSLEVRLLSDLQRSSFVPPIEGRLEEEGEEPVAPLRRVLDRLAELEIQVWVEDLGASALTPPNLGVEAIETVGELIGTGLTTEIAVRVRNHGSAGRAGVRVALSVDGERQPSRKIDVAAASTAVAIFPVAFREGGYHTLLAELEGDRLAVDDVRPHVLHVPPTLRVLLVNGDPSDEIDRDEVGYWRSVLEPLDDGLGASSAPFSTRTLTQAAFRAAEVDLGESDVIVLANVSTLDPATIERLEGRVAAGAALIITLGDRLSDARAMESFNARMWRADGSGLSPAKLARLNEVPSRRDDYHRVAEFDEEHPSLRFFSDERWRPFLTEVPIYAFVACRPLEGTRVLASLDDADQSPLLLEREYDRGRVYLWTTTADADWNRIPESPATLVPLVHELLREAGSARVENRNVDIGATLVAEVASFPRSPALLRPDSSRQPLDGEPSEVVEGVWRLPPLPQADQIGVWRVEMEGTEEVSFAVQFDPDEGDLGRVSHEELEGDHRTWRIRDQRGGGEDDSSDDVPKQGELWRWLAGACLAALVLETLWAAWIGRGRRIA